MFKRKYPKAFTLVELMVVIAIIGILSTIVSVNLSGAQKKSRDSRRIADLQALNSSLKMYYEDKDSYPDADVDNSDSNKYCTIGDKWDDNQTICLGEIQTLGFVSTLPTDPLSSSKYEYRKDDTNDVKKVILHATLEKITASSAGSNLFSDTGNDSSPRCNTGSTTDYCVVSPI